MSALRKRKLKAMMRAVGLIPPPPEPPRILTQVPVPFFSEPDEWPEHIAAYRAMTAKSQFGVLVDEPTCERVVFDDEHARYEQYVIAYQHWLITDGAEHGAVPAIIAGKNLRQQFRTWTPTSQAA